MFLNVNGFALLRLFNFFKFNPHPLRSKTLFIKIFLTRVRMTNDDICEFINVDEKNILFECHKN
jgi:hypothetical protein